MILYSLDQVQCKVGAFTLAIDKCELAAGEVYAVVGPNGSGKSTFLNMLGCLTVPSSGYMSFADRKVVAGQDLVPLRREIAYLTQNPYLFSMKVEENIGYGLLARGAAKGEAASRVRAIMDRMSISHLAGRRARDLSGGEAQRVALARTLVLDAKSVLLDEPTASVDIQNVRAVEKTVLELCRERGATLVLSTHAMDQAYRMSSKILSIVNGRIHGVACENVFEGRVAQMEGGTWAVDVGVALIVSTKPEGTSAIVAVESEDVVLSNEQLASSALNSFRGSVSRIDDSAAGLRVFVDIGVDLCAAVTRKSFETMQLQVGKDIWVSFKASSVKLL